MRRPWLAYLLTSVAAVGVGVAIAGLPGSLPGDGSATRPEAVADAATVTSVAPTVPPPVSSTVPPTSTPALTTTTPPTVSETSVTAPSTTEAPATTTSPPAATVPVAGAEDPQIPADRAAVPVAVANGAGVPGLAGDAATTLRAIGLTDVTSVNTDPAAVSSIYASSDDSTIAEVIASELGIPLTSIADRASAPIVDGDRSFEIIVVLGADRSP